VVFCQAREDSDKNGSLEIGIHANGSFSGDRLQRHLAIGSGEGEAIDELSAADPTGRWLVIRKPGSLTLLDSWSKKTTDLLGLGADPDNDRSSFREHRALSFDGMGTSLLYLARRDDKTRAVVRVLASEKEHVIDPGLSNVWRAELDHDGLWAAFAGFASDAGSKSWPAPKADGPAPCRSPLARYSAWLPKADPVVRTLASATADSATSAPGFVITLGKGWVVREPDGRLLLRKDGKDSELSPAKCGAKILHADARRTRLVVACTTPKGRPLVEIVGVGERHELGVDIASAPEDKKVGASDRLFALYPGTSSALVDLELAKLHKLHDGDIVITTRGARALVRRGKKLFVIDVERASEDELAAETETWPDVVVNGALAAVSPWVVKLDATQPLLGRVTGRPLALAPDGQVLVAPARGDQGVLEGPFEWKRPEESQ
jgi:hypothetical protein